MKNFKIYGKTSGKNDSILLYQNMLCTNPTRFPPVGGRRGWFADRRGIVLKHKIAYFNNDS